MKKLPLRDPGAALQRRAIAERRVGVGAKCGCGETRPLALIPKSKPKSCAKCQREKKGITIMRYADQIKPFNFLLSCHVKPLGHPFGTDPEHFHLMAPFEKDPSKWISMDWIDQYSGECYRITTVGHDSTRRTARVKTYGDVLREYEFHPESKCADAAGQPCGKQTIGLLQRRYIQIDQIRYIGKESNSLEEVDAGLIHSAQNVYTEYIDPARDEFKTKLLPALR